MMSVLTMLLRKMAKNRWLVMSLFAGMLCCIALTSSMPIYKSGVLQYMLVQDMDRSYASTGNHPGVVSVDITMRSEDKKLQAAVMDRFKRYWADSIIDSGSLHIIGNQYSQETVRFGLTPADPSRVDPDVKRSAKFAMRTGLEQHVRLVDGRLPAAEPVGGVYEAMVSDNALVELQMLLGQEYIVDDPRVERPIRVKPVAVISEQDLADVYWSRSTLEGERNALFLNDRLFGSELADGGAITIAKLGGLAVADYGKFDMDTAERMLHLKTNLSIEMLGNYNYSVSSAIWVPGSDAMSAYGEREATLRNLLWSLNVPLFILIVFYLYIVTGMLIERQKGEIAVLRSRGATRRHIMTMYAAEFGLLGLAALAIGPFVGAAFTRVLGSTNSFMSFVNRGSLQVELSGESWAYAVGAVLAAWIINLVPVFAATRASIVDQKRAKAREGKRPAWQLFGVDVLLLALAGYGYYSFRQRMADLVKLGLDGKELSSDPLLYTVPSLFILGAGLFLIRLYPMFVALVYRLGRSRWAPQHYSTLLLVTRRNRVYHGLMLFLILTIGTGVYNANTARTINGNMEDQILYAGGSDIVLRQYWANDKPASLANPSSGPQQQTASVSSKISYLEPPFELIESLQGVEQAAKVFVKEEADAWLGTKSGSVKLMGIDTDAFGETAWMKDGLLPYHFYDYLNVMAPDVHAVLLSKTAADYYGAKLGDVLDVGWEGIQPARFIVYGIVDYFPTFNPNPSAAEGSSNAASPMLIVGHLDTIQNELALEPYDVWMKLAEGTDRAALLQEMADKGIQLERFQDTIGSIAESRMDPFRMAINGVMSLGFIVSLAVSFIGFMLFWLLSLQGRMLQLGIYRAMGISFRQLLGMLMIEQLLTTGAGFLIGIATGLAAGRIFVPLFQLSFDPGRIVPPFEVISDSDDIVRLAVATAFMLAAALSILAWLLKRMNIYQAVKLGED